MTLHHCRPLCAQCTLYHPNPLVRPTRSHLIPSMFFNFLSFLRPYGPRREPHGRGLIVGRRSRSLRGRWSRATASGVIRPIGPTQRKSGVAANMSAADGKERMEPRGSHGGPRMRMWARSESRGWWRRRTSTLAVECGGCRRTEGMSDSGTTATDFAAEGSESEWHGG